MTTAPDVAPPAPIRLSATGRDRRDRRGSWIPTGGMIATRFMELRKRRGLMVALIVVTIGIPTLFLDHPPGGPRRGSEVLRTRRRVRHLQCPGRRCAVCLRVHRGRHARVHGRIRRPHRGDVPPPGGDRPLTVGAVPGADPGRAGHRRARGGSRLHHRLCGVRVRRTHPGQLPGGERPRRTLAGRFRALGRGPSQRGGLRFPVQQHPHQRTVQRPRGCRWLVREGPSGRRRPEHPVARRHEVRRGADRPAGLFGLLQSLPAPRRSASWSAPACGSSSRRSSDSWSGSVSGPSSASGPSPSS